MSSDKRPNPVNASVRAGQPHALKRQRTPGQGPAFVPSASDVDQLRRTVRQLCDFIEGAKHRKYEMGADVLVEAEARVGCFGRDSKFRTGMTDKQWNRIKDQLGQSNDWFSESMLSVDYAYRKSSFPDDILDSKGDVVKPGSERVTTDEDDVVIGHIYKRRIEDMTLQQALLHQDQQYNGTQRHDIRLHIATECDVQPRCTSVPEGWRSRRRKARWTFTPAHTTVWQVDLSRVTVEKPGSTIPKTSHEMEVEWLPEIFDMTSEDLVPTMCELVLTLIHLIRGPDVAQGFRDGLTGHPATRHLNGGETAAVAAAASPSAVLGGNGGAPSGRRGPPPPTTTQPAAAAPGGSEHDLANFGRHFVEQHLTPVADEEEIRTVRGYCTSCISALFKPGMQHFPGSLPVAFSRRHFATVQQADYWVSEKTDGVRYMLLVLTSQQAQAYGCRVYMMNRRFTVHRVRGYDALLAPLFGSDQGGPTLMDGEVVRHLSTNQPYYMVFDVLMLRGQDVGKERLPKRLAAIGDIVGSWRRAVQEGPAEAAPFVIIGKNFFHKNSVGTLFSKIRSQDQHYVYSDLADPARPGKRYHATDGIIITPSDPYHPMGQSNFFKWKFPGLITVDLGLHCDHHQQYKFMCAAGDNLVACRTVLWEKHNWDLLSQALMPYKTADMANEYDVLRRRNDIVVEVSYDLQRGCWRFHHLRADKKRPNQVTTVMETMECVAENVTQAELIKKLSSAAPRPHQ